MMQALSDLFSNYHLICSLLAFLTAQFIKFILTLIFMGKIDFRKFFENGGMPSSHTSTVWALTVSVGRVCGFGSPIAAVSVIFTMVVMIDAMGVRRATGENAKVINRIAKDLFEWKTVEYMGKNLKEYVGHKPLEVLIGAIIGLIIPIVIAPF